MNSEELENRKQTIQLLTGIALPGVIGRAGIIYDPKDVAKDAFNIAVATYDYMEARFKQEAEASVEVKAESASDI